MGVISGINAAVNGQSTARGWSINWNKGAPDPRAKNTGGSPVLLSGNDDWSGSFDFYGVVPSVMPGSSFTFTGDTGAPGSFSGTAMMESLTINVDVEGGNIVSGTCNFAANETTLTAGTTSVSDATAPDVNSAVNLDLKWGGSSGTARAGLRSYTFTIARELKSFVVAGTNGLTARRSSGLIVSGSWQEYEGLTASLIAPGTLDLLACYVTGSTFYEFKYAKITSVETDPNAESGDLVSATHNWSFSGYSGSTQGYVKLPSTSNYWP